MSVEIANLCKSLGSVNGTTGAMVSGGDQVTSAQTSAGVYTLTIGFGGLDSTECVCQVTPRGSAARHAVVAQTSDTVKTVRVFDAAGNAANSDFDFVIWETPKGITP